MKKALLWSVFAWMLCASMGIAAEPVAPLPQTPQPAIAGESCHGEAVLPLVADEASTAPAPLDLFTPEAQPAAICPLIGCVNEEYCRRDRDCTTAPGGVCNLFCPTQGCCRYP